MGIGNSPTMYLRYAGGGRYVGIGNSAPEAKLHVSGNVIFGGDSSTTSDVRFTRLNSTYRAISHWYVSSTNTPTYLFGQHLSWSGERVGTVDSSMAYRPYYEFLSDNIDMFPVKLVERYLSKKIVN